MTSSNPFVVAGQRRAEFEVRDAAKAAGFQNGQNNGQFGMMPMNGGGMNAQQPQGGNFAPQGMNGSGGGFTPGGGQQRRASDRANWMLAHTIDGRLERCEPLASSEDFFFLTISIS